MFYQCSIIADFLFRCSLYAVLLLLVGQLVFVPVIQSGTEQAAEEVFV